MRFSQITEDRNIVYHGDNVGTTRLDPKWMFHDNSNNQEGVGIYFSPDINAAEAYGPKICSISLDGLIILPSRSIVDDHINKNNAAQFIRRLNEIDDDFWYIYTDYGIMVTEPEEIEDYHHMVLVESMQFQEFRNWQIELAEYCGNIVQYVRAWNQYIGIDGLYEENSGFYSIIATDIVVTPINF